MRTLWTRIHIRVCHHIQGLGYSPSPFSFGLKAYIGAAPTLYLEVDAPEIPPISTLDNLSLSLFSVFLRTCP